MTFCTLCKLSYLFTISGVLFCFCICLLTYPSNIRINNLPIFLDNYCPTILTSPPRFFSQLRAAKINNDHHQLVDAHCWARPPIECRIVLIPTTMTVLGRRIDNCSIRVKYSSGYIQLLRYPPVMVTQRNLLSHGINKNGCTPKI